MNFDLSKLKKVEHDDRSATFRHPDGHMIKIAMGPLSEKMRQKMADLPIHGQEEQKFAKGGEAKPTPPPPPTPPVDPEKAKKFSQGFNNALGFAEGGDVREPASEKPEEFTPGKDYSEAAKTGEANPIAPVTINIGADAQKSIQPEANSTGAVTGQPEFHAAGATPEAPPAPKPVAAVQPQAPAQAPQAPVQPPVQAQAPLQEAPVREPRVSQPQQTYDDFKAQQTQENQSLEADLANNHITPQTYSTMFAKKDTLGKISTIFGLLLSGAGSGLSHQPNALLSMMDKEIDRDLDAQKADAQDKFNLLNLSKKQLLDNANVAHINQETAEGKQKLSMLAQNDAKQKALQFAFHQQQVNVAKMPEGPEKEKAKLLLGHVYNSVKEHITKLEDINAGIAATAGILGPATDAQKHVDTNYAKDYNEWTSTGKANIESNIKDLEDAKAALKKNPNLSGGLTGSLPDRLTSNDVLRQRQLVRSAIMGSLRQILGAQFTEGEGERIFNTVYNEKADSKVNDQSLNAYLTKLKNIRSENEAKAKYYEKNGTLTKFKAADLERAPEPEGDTVERVDPKSGRTIIFDAKTKKPLRWK